MAIQYVLGGGAGTRTFVDLGLASGSVSLDGETILVRGSVGDNSFFLRPSNYEFEFVDIRGGTNTVYLTGARSDYTYATVDDTAVLTRAGEKITLAISASVRVVFADRMLLADNLSAATGGDTSQSSLAVETPDPATLDGTVRVALTTLQNGTAFVGLRDAVFSAFGNGGVDHVYVTAGANVDATNLGAGKDLIYFEGAWNDYTKTLNGTTITFQRQWIDTFGTSNTEKVEVVGGTGLNNDRLLFADGSIDSRVALVNLYGDPNKTSADLGSSFNQAITSQSSAVGLVGVNPISLSVDTGLSANDNVTNNGTIKVSGLAPGFKWQYRIEGGLWTSGATGSDTFTLPDPLSGTKTYDVGTIEVRQINPFGVASEIASNAAAISLDKTPASSGPTFDSLPIRAAKTGLLPSPGHTYMRVDPTYADAVEGYTIQFWVYLSLDIVESTAAKQLVSVQPKSGLSAYLRDGGKVYFYDGSSWTEAAGNLAGADAAEGWNFFSLTRIDSEIKGVVFNDVHTTGRALQVDQAFVLQNSDLTPGNTFFGSGWNGGTGARELDAYWRDIRLWNGDRSAVASSDKSGQINASDSNLVAHWKLNDPTGGVAYNYKSGGPDLEFFNGATTGHTNSQIESYDGNHKEDIALYNRPVISGAGADAFAKVSVFRDTDVLVGTAIADSHGNWTLSSDIPIPPVGTVTFSATQTDLAGNESPASVNPQSAIVLDRYFDRPQLLPSADTGFSSDDGVTNVGEISLTGVLPADIASSNSFSLLRNGEAIASVSNKAEGQNEGLTIDYDGATWSYEQPTGSAQWPDGQYEVVLIGEPDRSSLPLIVTIDRAVDAPVIVSSPPLIQAQDGTSIFQGTAAADTETITVSYINRSGAEEVLGTSTVNPVNGSWSLSFSVNQINAADGSIVFSVTAEDLAGNTATTQTGTITLELVNEAPVASANVPVVLDVLPNAPGGSIIFDLTDMDADVGTNDPAFSDPDAAGSANGTLIYSAMQQNGHELPSWLEVTAGGLVRVANGQTAPNSVDPIQLAVTATDGSGASQSINFIVEQTHVLASPLTGMSAVDVRSALSIDGGGALEFGEQGTYSIVLDDTQSGSPGFGGEVENGGINVEITLDAQKSISTVKIGEQVVSNETVAIDGQFLLLDLPMDLDLGTVYRMSVDAGLVRKIGNVGANDPFETTFTTVTPMATAGGAAATRWDGSAMVEGATWFDGTGGTYTNNNSGQSFDLISVEGVVVVGRDVAPTAEAITLESSFRTSLSGFSSDDALYIDQKNTDPRNTVTVDNVAISQVGAGGTGTILQFSSNGELGGAIITFADRPAGLGNESTLEAYQFVASPHTISGIYGFEDLTGNANPVISG